jgi:hypothetical protein
MLFWQKIKWLRLVCLSLFAMIVGSQLAQGTPKKANRQVQREWIIEGSGESPDLKQLPQFEPSELSIPLETDLPGYGQESTLQLLLRDLTDLDAGTALPPETWKLSADGKLSPAMSLP